MEEYIGNLWDRFIARLAYRGYPEAAVDLEEMAGLLPPFFRALEGDPGLSVKPASAIPHGARRRLLQELLPAALKKSKPCPCVHCLPDLKRRRRRGNWRYAPLCKSRAVWIGYPMDAIRYIQSPVNLTPATLSRVLHTLTEAGLVTVKGRRIVVHSLERLCRFEQ